MAYESLEAFLKDRQVDHATDATHRFETAEGGAKFAGLVDRRTREQDEFQDLAEYVGRYKDEKVKVQEFLSPTFTLDTVFTPILITDPVPNSQHTKQTNTRSPRPQRPNPLT